MKKILLITLLLLMPIGFVLAKDATLVNPNSGDRVAVEVDSTQCSQYFTRGYELEVAYGYQPLPEDMLGFSVVSSYKTTLSASMTSTQSTINVSSVTAKDDTTLTMALLGTKAFLTIEPGGRKEEIVMCTGISGSAWTGCTRGLSFTGTSTVAVAANKETHSAGSTIIMSNVHYVYDELVDKDSTETLAGVKTFSSYPKIETYAAPTADEQFAPKKYVDDTSFAGAPDMTTTVKGISEKATAAEAAANAADGSGDTTAPLTLTSAIASSTSASENLVVVTESDGKINQGFLDLTEDFTFSGDITVATSTVATSTINSLTSASSTITQLNLNGVDANDLVGLNDASLLHTHSIGSFGSYATSTITTGTVQTITHNLGYTPNVLKMRTIVTGANEAGPGFQSDGYYDGTSQASLSFYKSGNPGYSGILSTDYIMLLDTDASASQNGINVTASALTSTTFTLTYSVTSSAPMAFIWEVY